MINPLLIRPMEFWKLLTPNKVLKRLFCRERHQLISKDYKF